MSRTFLFFLFFLCSSSLFAGDTAQFIGGQSDDVTKALYSPDGKYIVTGGWNGELYIYVNDTVPYYYLSFQDNHTKVTSMAFSRDSRRLLVGSFDGQILSYHFPPDSVMDYIRLDTTFSYGKSPVNELCIGPTGRMLYAGDDAGQLTAMDLKKKESKTIKAAGPITAFAVSVDRKNYYVAVKGSSEIIQYNIFGKEIRRFTGHQGEVTGLIATLDRKQLISSSNDKTVKIWDLNKAKESISLSHHQWDITGISADPLTRYVASCGLDGMVNIYEVGNGRLMKQYKNRNGRCTDVAFSPDLQHVIVGLHMEEVDSEGHGINLWTTGIQPPRPKNYRPSSGNRPVRKSTSTRSSSTSKDTGEKAETPKNVIHKSEQVEISIEE